MLDKFLRDVVVVVVGKPAEPIAELLNTKKHVKAMAWELNIEEQCCSGSKARSMSNCAMPGMKLGKHGKWHLYVLA